MAFLGMPRTTGPEPPEPQRLKTTVPPPPPPRAHGTAPVASGFATPASVPVTGSRPTKEPNSTVCAQEDPSTSAESDADIHLSPEESSMRSLSTETLRKCAKARGGPCGLDQNRDNLMETLRLCKLFESMSYEQLQAFAKSHGLHAWADGEGSAADRMKRAFWPNAAPEGVRQPTPSKPAVQESVTPSPPRAAPSKPVVHEAPAATERSVQRSVPEASLQSDDDLIAEVRRILAAASTNYLAVLGLQGREATVQAAQSRYRQLMRLLHPDKRTATGVARAGGREACDLAMGKVQEASKMAEVALSRQEKARSAERLLASKPVRPPAPKAPGPPMEPPPPPPSGAPPERIFGVSQCQPLPRPVPPFSLCSVLIVN